MRNTDREVLVKVLVGMSMGGRYRTEGQANNLN